MSFSSSHQVGKMTQQEARVRDAREGDDGIDIGSEDSLTDEETSDEDTPIGQSQRGDEDGHRNPPAEPPSLEVDQDGYHSNVESAPRIVSQRAFTPVAARVLPVNKWTTINDPGVDGSPPSTPTNMFTEVQSPTPNVDRERVISHAEVLRVADTCGIMVSDHQRAYVSDICHTSPRSGRKGGHRVIPPDATARLPGRMKSVKSSNIGQHSPVTANSTNMLNFSKGQSVTPSRRRTMDPPIQTMSGSPTPAPLLQTPQHQPSISTPQADIMVTGSPTSTLAPDSTPRNEERQQNIIERMNRYHKTTCTLEAVADNNRKEQQRMDEDALRNNAGNLSMDDIFGPYQAPPGLEQIAPNPTGVSIPRSVCFCCRPNNGRMVTCSGSSCLIKHYHYTCLATKEKRQSTIQNVKWVCEHCVAWKIKKDGRSDEEMATEREEEEAQWVESALQSTKLSKEEISRMMNPLWVPGIGNGVYRPYGL